MGLPCGGGALLLRRPFSRAGSAAIGLSGRDGPEPAGAGTGAASIPSDTAGPRTGARALGAGVAAEGAPASPPAALVEATLRAALPLSAAAAGVSGSVIGLTQGVLRSMFLIKLRTVGATIIAIAALAAGAQSLLRKAPAKEAHSNHEQIRAELGAEPPATLANARHTRKPARLPRISSGPTSPLPRACASSSSLRPNRKAITQKSRHGRGLTLTCCANTWTNSSRLNCSAMRAASPARLHRPANLSR